jgi:membrane glycosyltransferase
VLVPPTYFHQPEQLFPLWPEWHSGWALTLAGVTAAQLFLPKLLALGLALARDAKRFGGAAALTIGVLLECVVSALLAPVRMLFHSRFVIAALSGWRGKWKSPPRDDAQTGWGEALRRHGWHTLLGALWAGLVWWLEPASLPWLAPVVGALLLSIPLSVLTSRRSAGLALRRAGLLLIPEECTPPPELARVAELLAEPAPWQAREPRAAAHGPAAALPSSRFKFDLR